MMKIKKIAIIEATASVICSILLLMKKQSHLPALNPYQRHSLRQITTKFLLAGR